MQFDTQSRRTIRGTANWGLALGVVMLVSSIAGLGGLLDDGWKRALLSLAWTAADLLCGLALVRACLGLRQVDGGNASLDDTLGSLRTHFRIHCLMILAVPVLLPLVLILGPLAKLL